MAKKYLSYDGLTEYNALIKTEIDERINVAKNDLLNGAGEAYDTLKELGDLIDENQDAIDALEIIAAAKSDWNQNDETAIDYIKNRTHYDNRTSAPLNLTFNGDYENYEHVLLIDGGRSQIYVAKVSDSVISHEDLSVCNIVYTTLNELNNYDYTNYNASEYFSLNGNNSFATRNMDFIIRDDEIEVIPNVVLSKGIWFMVNIQENEMISCTQSFTSDTIMLDQGELKKLDEKFLPDNIATEEYVDTSLLGAMDLTSDQTVSGVKTFSNGIKMGGATMSYNTTEKAIIFTFE